MDKKMRKRLGFVLQEDIFFASLTLKETLYFTSMIRLPESIPTADKLQQIDDLAEVLDVKKCLDTRMGDMFSPGLSGGEKKRASIICELLTNPDILLLDEPTSGLDSSTALALMQQLRKLADEKNKIVIFSIHQPSSQMYHMFDKLLLLAQGKVAFVGERSDALVHLEQVGFECGIHYNPADFISNSRTKFKFISASYVAINSDSSDNRTVKETLEETQKWPTSFSTQLRMLSWRTFKVSRGRILHLYELLQALILAVVLGLVFFQIPHTIESIRDRMGLVRIYCLLYALSVQADHTVFMLRTSVNENSLHPDRSDDYRSGSALFS
ncbi:hypothetical protein ACJMK2_025104 [Sinanodonta woodiana]|uniref:ABC transporter domain-containing protein n=1 Tax=Sinanodonta woodiana TaxID=1069815 RepID=A0ABD3XFY3_SINWO